MTAPDETDLMDDPFIRAGEYVLGLLEGEERAISQRDLLAGEAFAQAVAWWENKFSPLAEEAGEVQPSTRVWPAIAARLNGDSQTSVPTAQSRPSAEKGLSGWRLGGALAASAAVAAALVLAVVMPGSATKQVAPTMQPAKQQLIAQLHDETANRRLASRFDPGSQTISLQLAGLAPDNPETRAAELWIVPEGEAPISLGLIPGEGKFSRKLTADQAGLLVAGATIAVTIEDRQTAPHKAPTTPILIAGPLTKI